MLSLQEFFLGFQALFVLGERLQQILGGHIPLASIAWRVHQRTREEGDGVGCGREGRGICLVGKERKGLKRRDGRAKKKALSTLEEGGRKGAQCPWVSLSNFSNDSTISLTVKSHFPLKLNCIKGKRK